MATSTGQQIMSALEVRRALARMTQEILEMLQPDKHGLDDVVLVGIWTRGVYLARRLAQLIHDSEGLELTVGVLNVGLHRDDIVDTNISLDPNTDIPGGTHAKRVVLVDDVLYTGRTIRAAMDALTDLGRPSRILLTVLIDRGHRELPIRADTTGKDVRTEREEVVKVRLTEHDDVDADQVVVLRDKS
ncbi:bifunctional pyr operon transcriptional regulator/uracil phosphoribosyltransferase PyrR [Patescibacteria group bacterium]|nr:bifunctional pyr operon transcriptional regulator/uracil phosphoribosyltransferase PyrR [Patescibacteria group bacterium]